MQYLKTSYLPCNLSQNCSSLRHTVCQRKRDLWTPRGVGSLVPLVRQTVRRDNEDLLHHQWRTGISAQNYTYWFRTTDWKKIFFISMWANRILSQLSINALQKSTDSVMGACQEVDLRSLPLTQIHSVIQRSGWTSEGDPSQPSLLSLAWIRCCPHKRCFLGILRASFLLPLLKLRALFP